MLSEIELEFLQQSNFIEGVSDSESLDQAVFAWNWMKSQDELTTHFILKAHKILMLKQHLQPDEKGYWRHCEVMIGGRLGKPWREVPTLMAQWIARASFDDKWELIKRSHIDFEYIHPFVDGNGRIGRMVMNWQRLRAGLKVMVIKEEDRFDYYQWFKQGK